MNRFMNVSLAASIAMVCMSAATCLAASYPRLAIVVQSDGTMNTAQIERLKARLTGKLLQSHAFAIVDRKRLKTVLKQLGISNSAYADPNSAAHLGKIVGATEILYVSVSSKANDSKSAFVDGHEFHAKLSYHLLDVDSTRVITTGVAEGSGSQRSEHMGAVDRLKITNDAIVSCADELARQVLNQQ